MPIHNKDYILRLIEELGMALRELSSSLHQASPDELAKVEGEIDGSAARAGLDLGLAENLALDNLSILVGSGGDLYPSRCLLLAELLYMRGLISDRRGEIPEANNRFTRALALYSMLPAVLSEEFPLEQRDERIREIEGRLETLGNDWEASGG